MYVADLWKNIRAVLDIRFLWKVEDEETFKHVSRQNNSAISHLPQLLQQ
jgi:hypothetical protein